MRGSAHRDAPLRRRWSAITEYAVVLTADSIFARSTRRRQTSTGWNTAYIGANRYTLRPDEKPPADDALHPMAFLVDPPQASARGSYGRRRGGPGAKAAQDNARKRNSVPAK